MELGGGNVHSVTSESCMASQQKACHLSSCYHIQQLELLLLLLGQLVNVHLLI